MSMAPARPGTGCLGQGAKDMKRCRAILLLLLAICLVAGPVLPPAADAAQTTDQSTGSPTGPAVGANGEPDAGGSGRGDPGGAGDGLGVDPNAVTIGSAQSGVTNAALELLLQLLRLMQAAG